MPFQISEYINVTVGTVAVALKVVCILLFSTGMAMCLNCIKRLSAMSLSWYGKAPIMYARDINVLAMYGTGKRVRSIPLYIFMIVFLAISLVPAEIVADFGVSSSDKCKPEKLITIGLCGADSKSGSSFATNLETAYQIEDLQWDEQVLADYPIRQGARKSCDGTEYYGNRVKRNTSLPVVIYRCSVRKLRVFQPDETKLVLGKGGKGAFTDDLVQFKGVIYRNDTFRGYGAIFNNFKDYSGFLVSKQDDGADGSNSALVVEYPDSEHMAEIEKRARNSTEYIIPARSSMLAYEVGCRYASMNDDLFQSSIGLFRYAMLSRSAHRRFVPRVNITVHGQNIRVPQPMKASDIVKGVYSTKVSEINGCWGETFVYTECGDYDAKMAIPVIIVYLIIVVVWISVLFITCHGKRTVVVPITKMQWMKLAILRAYDEERIVHVESEEYNEYRGFGDQTFMGEIVLRKEASENSDKPFIFRKVVFEYQDKYNPSYQQDLV